MQFKMYTVKDIKADYFNKPMVFRNHGEAIRVFLDSGAEVAPFAKHPDDFVLYCIGEFSEDTGLIKAYDIERLGSYADLKG